MVNLRSDNMTWPRDLAVFSQSHRTNSADARCTDSRNPGKAIGVPRIVTLYSQRLTLEQYAT